MKNWFFLFFILGFPTDTPLGQELAKHSSHTGKSKFEGRKIYTPDFQGQGRIKAREEIKVNFRGLRLFNKRHLREHKKMLFQKFEKRDPQYADIYEHKYGTRGTGIRLVKFLV